MQNAEMRVIAELGCEDIAKVYIAETTSGNKIEFVESLEPPIPRQDKWVNIISTLFGCPVKCQICDAGSEYNGKLSTSQLLYQIDYLVKRRYPDRKVTTKKWKVQFARMGEPAFNSNVLETLEKLPERYDAPGLMPCISTIAPHSCSAFFDRLLKIKHKLYPRDFQLQFSIHSTDWDVRRDIIPVKTWNLREIAEYGRQFNTQGGRKVSLNFALIENVPVETSELRKYFDPEIFIIKVTPLNPTYSVIDQGIKPLDIHSTSAQNTIDDLRSAGYEVIVSIGELEENAIGSNCGQFVSSIERESKSQAALYTYQPVEVKTSLSR